MSGRKRRSPWVTHSSSVGVCLVRELPIMSCGHAFENSFPVSQSRVMPLFFTTPSTSFVKLEQKKRVPTTMLNPGGVKRQNKPKPKTDNCVSVINHSIKRHYNEWKSHGAKINTKRKCYTSLLYIKRIFWGV